jgi:hypothetical protein
MTLHRNEVITLTTPNAPKVGAEISAKDLAAELNIDAKALRSIMRKMTSADTQPGSGGRWVIVRDSELYKELLVRVSKAHHRKVTKFGA